MGSAYVMPAATGSHLPTSSSSDFIDDDSSGESDSPMPSSDLSIDHRHYPPRQSSQINSTYPHNASTEPYRRGESIVDEEKYYKAYWAKVHEMRRHDSQSLPLVPYTDRDFGIMDEKNEYHAPPRNARAYPDFPQRRPLINYIHNEWRNSSHSYGKSPTERNITSWTQVLSAPLFRRSALIFLLILSLLWGNWKLWVQSEWQEHTYLNNALHGPLKPGLSKFGSNVRPAFRDMIHMRTLNQKLIPQKGDTKRLIVIGDVHGCVKECTLANIGNTPMDSESSPARGTSTSRWFR